MGFLILLFVIFVGATITIWLFPPDAMSEEENYKTDITHLWGLVKICQTANFRRPSLVLQPARRKVTMELYFRDSETLTVALPLILKKQQQARAKYLQLFSEHSLKIVEFENRLVAYFDRQDENLGKLIAQLYRDVFDASDKDIVKFTIRTLKSDIRMWRHYNVPITFNDEATFQAPSSRHKGKSVLNIQIARIIEAASFLLFPSLIIFSYTFWGITGLCWNAFAYFGFFAVYNATYKNEPIASRKVMFNLLNCTLLLSTLTTQNTVFLQSIPSINGILWAVIFGALHLGISEPTSKNDIKQKQNNLQHFKLINSFQMAIGVVIFLANELARHHYDFENWVWFYALIRFELMFPLIIIFIPTYMYFLRHQEDADKA